MLEFDLTLKEMNQFVKQTYETATKNTVGISKLSDMKVESKEFYAMKDHLLE